MRLIVTGIAALLAAVVAFVPTKGAKPFFGVALEGYPVSSQLLSEVETLTGMRPQLVNFFLQWRAPLNKSELKGALTALWNTGAVPVITWEPMYFDGTGTPVRVSLEELKEGVFDQYIDDFGGALAEWGDPVLVRFAHEMNLSSYHWGGSQVQFDEHAPSRYQEMFRYVVERVRQKGAKNALWVFCPNNDSVPSSHEAPWNKASSYYPGDDYVDILGMDGYNWGTTVEWQSSPKEFRELFSELRAELTALAPVKPLLVFETASVGTESEKREWLGRALLVAEEWGLIGVNWFHVNKERDWRLPSGVRLKGGTKPQAYFRGLTQR